MNASQCTIYRYLVDQLVGGRLGVGDRLPTENELGERFHTTRMNAHYAITQLKKHGIVERRKRIGTEVIKEISPALARELRGEANRRICVIHHDDEEYGYIHWNDSTLAGLEPALTANDVEISYRDFTGVSCRNSLIEHLQEIADEGFSGIVLLLGNREEDVVYTQNQDILYLYFKNIFIFLRDSSQRQMFPFHTVSVSNFHEGVLAVEYLYEKGYQDIIFNSRGFTEHDWQAERYAGVSAAVLRHSEGQQTVQNVNGTDAMVDVMRNTDKSWSIITVNDRTAALLIDALTEAGFKRGSDYRIVSFDDDSEFRHYELTTVAPPLREIGEEIGRLICEAVDIKTPNHRNSNTLLHSVEMVERKL